MFIDKKIVFVSDKTDFTSLLIQKGYKVITNERDFKKFEWRGVDWIIFFVETTFIRKTSHQYHVDIGGYFALLYLIRKKVPIFEGYISMVSKKYESVYSFSSNPLRPLIVEIPFRSIVFKNKINNNFIEQSRIDYISFNKIHRAFHNGDISLLQKNSTNEGKQMMRKIMQFFFSFFNDFL